LNLDVKKAVYSLFDALIFASQIQMRKIDENDENELSKVARSTFGNGKVPEKQKQAVGCVFICLFFC
jgi:hypothetical protein